MLFYNEMEGWKVGITITVQSFTKPIKIKEMIIIIVIVVNHVENLFLNNVSPPQFFLRIIHDTEIILSQVSFFPLSRS